MRYASERESLASLQRACLRMGIPVEEVAGKSKAQLVELHNDQVFERESAAFREWIGDRTPRVVTWRQ